MHREDNETTTTTATRIVTEYIAAYTSGDVGKALSLVSDDFSFRGPTQLAVGKDALAAVLAHVASSARGHRMLHQWRDADEVSSLYEFNVETPEGATSVLVSEWNTVRDGEVASSVMVFDTGPFQAPRPVDPAPVDPSAA